MNIKKVFCKKCSLEREYVIIDNINYDYMYGDMHMKYIGKIARCKHCKEEVWVEEVKKYNHRAFADAYCDILMERYGLKDLRNRKLK